MVSEAPESPASCSDMVRWRGELAGEKGRDQVVMTTAGVGKEGEAGSGGRVKWDAKGEMRGWTSCARVGDRGPLGWSASSGDEETPGGRRREGWPR